jgi:hypothetical protein
MDHYEILHAQHPDPDKISCKDCAYKNGGGMQYPRFTKSNCEKYPVGRCDKPGKVLFLNTKCELYEHE